MADEFEYPGDERRKPCLFHQQQSDRIDSLEQVEKDQVEINIACELESKHQQKQIERHGTEIDVMSKTQNKLLGGVKVVGVIVGIAVTMTLVYANSVSNAVEKIESDLRPTVPSVAVLQANMHNVVKSVEELKEINKEDHKLREAENKEINKILMDILGKLPK